MFKQNLDDQMSGTLRAHRTSPLDLDGLVYEGTLGLLFHIFIIVAILNCMSTGTSFHNKEAV